MIQLLLAVFLAAVSAPLAAAQGLNEFDEAREAINRGDIDGAIGLYDRMLDGVGLGPDGQATAYSFRSFAYLLKAQSSAGDTAKKHFQQAIADAGDAIHRAPDDVRAHFVRGAAFSYTGRFDDAIKDLDIMIGLDPHMPEAYVARGFAHNGKGDYDKAIGDFSAAIERRPFYAIPFKLRGVARGYSGQYDKAVADFDEAIKLNPADVETYYDRGIAYFNGGKNDKAIADFDIVAGAQPKNAAVFAARGRVRAASGEYDLAIADFDTALGFNPKDAESHYYRAVAYSGRGDYAKAVADLTDTIKAKPGLFDAYFARGRNQFYAGNYGEAANDIERSLAIRPNDAYRSLWLHFARANEKKDDAQELARNIGTPDTTAWPGPLAAYFLGQATTEQVMAAASQPGDARTRKLQGCQAAFYLGEDALLRGDADAAAKRLAEARETCPRFFVEYEAAAAELKRMGK